MKPIVVPVRQGTPEWREWRRGGYGASDVGTLVDGDERAWNELHLQKLGILPDPAPTEAMEYGTEVEDVIARAYAKREREPVIRVPWGLQHPEIPAARASLDRRRRRGRVIVELKSWSYPSADFGPDGSDQVPMRWVYQVHQQMLVAGDARADIAVLFGASKRMRVYRIGRDQGLIDEVVALETAAWIYVQRGEVPPWPGPAPERPQLKADEIPADDELVELVYRHDIASVQADAAAAALKEVKDELRERLHDVGGTRGVLPDGRPFSVGHRPNRDGTQVGWESLYTAARKRLLELGVPEADLDFAVTALTTTKPGARPLNVRIAEEARTHAAA